MTDLDIAPTRRDYDGPFDNCPWFADGSCGAYIDLCLAGAVHSAGKDHQICLQYDRDVIGTAYSAWGYHSCGHCQTNLPCSNGLPPRLARQRAKLSGKVAAAGV